MSKNVITLIGLGLACVVLYLLALPLAFLALIGFEKLIRPASNNHVMLELLLLLATLAGLFSPLAFASQRLSTRIQVLIVCATIMAIAIAALFSPLYRGFVH